MARLIFCERLQFVGNDRDAPLSEALHVLEEWVYTWTNRYSPRFFDPATTKTQAIRIDEILKDQSFGSRFRRWMRASQLDYIPEEELEKIAKTSGRQTLVDCASPEEWIAKALDSLRNSPTDSIRLDLLRRSTNDDTALYLDLQIEAPDSLSIQLVVYSFAALEDKTLGGILRGRLQALIDSGRFCRLDAEPTMVAKS
ncbi:MAG: hypothetical protein AAFR91_13340 [Pseudomonadota bacterium]